VLALIEPEKFGANTGPAKVYFQWAQHEMYISPEVSRDYFTAVDGPKGQKLYFTSPEFNDAEWKSDRTSWLMHTLKLNTH
jgi:hypothetical protein